MCSCSTVVHHSINTFIIDALWCLLVGNLYIFPCTTLLNIDFHFDIRFCCTFRALDLPILVPNIGTFPQRKSIFFSPKKAVKFPLGKNLVRSKKRCIPVRPIIRSFRRNPVMVRTAHAHIVCFVISLPDDIRTMFRTRCRIIPNLIVKNRQENVIRMQKNRSVVQTEYFGHVSRRPRIGDKRNPTFHVKISATWSGRKWKCPGWACVDASYMRGQPWNW